MGVPYFYETYGRDANAVVETAFKKAREGYEVILLDTPGRQQEKEMKEMAKVCRGRRVEGRWREGEERERERKEGGKKEGRRREEGGKEGRGRRREVTEGSGRA
jgi:signal recognition particle GTPase